MIIIKVNKIIYYLSSDKLNLLKKMRQKRQNKNINMPLTLKSPSNISGILPQRDNRNNIAYFTNQDIDSKSANIDAIISNNNHFSNSNKILNNIENLNVDQISNNNNNFGTALAEELATSSQKIIFDNETNKNYNNLNSIKNDISIDNNLASFTKNEHPSEKENQLPSKREENNQRSPNELKSKKNPFDDSDSNSNLNANLSLNPTAQAIGLGAQMASNEELHVQYQQEPNDNNNINGENYLNLKNEAELAPNNINNNDKANYNPNSFISDTLQENKSEFVGGFNSYRPANKFTLGKTNSGLFEENQDNNFSNRICSDKNNHLAISAEKENNINVNKTGEPKIINDNCLNTIENYSLAKKNSNDQLKKPLRENPLNTSSSQENSNKNVTNINNNNNIHSSFFNNRSEKLIILETNLELANKKNEIYELEIKNLREKINEIRLNMVNSNEEVLKLEISKIKSNLTIKEQENQLVINENNNLKSKISNLESTINKLISDHTSFRKQTEELLKNQQKEFEDLLKNKIQEINHFRNTQILLNENYLAANNLVTNNNEFLLGSESNITENASNIYIREKETLNSNPNNFSTYQRKELISKKEDLSLNANANPNANSNANSNIIPNTANANNNLIVSKPNSNNNVNMSLNLNASKNAGSSNNNNIINNNSNNPNNNNNNNILIQNELNLSANNIPINHNLNSNNEYNIANINSNNDNNLYDQNFNFGNFQNVNENIVNYDNNYYNNFTNGNPNVIEEVGSDNYLNGNTYDEMKDKDDNLHDHEYYENSHNLNAMNNANSNLNNIEAINNNMFNINSNNLSGNIIYDNNLNTNNNLYENNLISGNNNNQYNEFNISNKQGNTGESYGNNYYNINASDFKKGESGATTTKDVFGCNKSRINFLSFLIFIFNQTHIFTNIFFRL